MSSESERFWAKVDRVGQCWLWTAALNIVDGYGRFHLDGNGKLVLAHRYAYAEANGPIAPGLMIDHVCHTPACVRPTHLRIATSKQNNENRGVLNKNSTSGFRGVSWDKRERRWRAHLVHNRKQITSYFPTADEANAWVVAKRIELFTHNELDRVAS